MGVPFERTMRILTLLWVRLVRILANLSKLLSYGYHAVFPAKRFVLPAESGPLWRSKKTSRIPRIIWQTNFTDRVTLPVYLNYLFNRLISPTYAYRFHGDESARAFIAAHYGPEIITQYEQLQIGAAKADLWRVLVLHAVGGAYLDVDAHMMRPLEFVLDPEDDDAYVITRRGEVSNYFFASRPGNPNLARIIDRILENIRNPVDNNVFNITGPGVFVQLLDVNAVKTCPYKFTCAQGTFTNEHFQYMDRKNGKWTRVQERMSVVKKAGD